MIVSCPVCFQRKIKLILKKKQYSVLQCQFCHFGWLKNPLPYEDLINIYNKNYFADKKPLSFIADAQHKLNFVKKYLPKKAKILDYGCGLGDFISLAKKDGHQLSAYDISHYATDFVFKKYRISVSASSLRPNSFKRNYFDAITCFDVIEHLINFLEVLNLFHCWLKPTGFLFLTTPNIESWDKKILGKNWYGFTKFPEHINYFSPASIKLVFAKIGFKTVKIYQWGFVRNLDFIFKNFPLLRLISRRLMINKINIYFPVIDIMALAQKI